jgi:uncharacterized Zn finger protein
MPDTVAPFCPTCTSKQIMWHDGQGYVFGAIYQLWRCLTCGTVVEAHIQCHIRRPSPASVERQQEGET